MKAAAMDDSDRLAAYLTRVFRRDAVVTAMRAATFDNESRPFTAQDSLRSQLIAAAMANDGGADIAESFGGHPYQAVMQASPYFVPSPAMTAVLSGHTPSRPAPPVATFDYFVSFSHPLQLQTPVGSTHTGAVQSMLISPRRNEQLMFVFGRESDGLIMQAIGPRPTSPLTLRLLSLLQTDLFDHEDAIEPVGSSAITILDEARVGNLVHPVHALNVGRFKTVLADWVPRARVGQVATQLDRVDEPLEQLTWPSALEAAQRAPELYIAPTPPGAS